MLVQCPGDIDTYLVILINVTQVLMLLSFGQAQVSIYKITIKRFLVTFMFDDLVVRNIVPTSLKSLRE